MSEIKNVYVLEWIGPFNSKDEMDERTDNCCVYLITGKFPYDRINSIKYVGITGRSVSERVHEKDHLRKQEQIKGKQYWAGYFSKLSDNDISTRKKRERAELVEYLLVRYLYLKVKMINEKKTKSNPPKAVVVISRWQKRKDGEYRYNKPRSLAALPDTLLYCDDEFWYSDKLRVSNI